MVSQSTLYRRGEIREKPEVDFIFEKGKKGSAEVVREGLLRRRIAVGSTWAHLLTERQRTVLHGKPRMSRAWVRMLKDIKETRTTMEDFVKTLSPEELVRGEIKDKNGNFRGRPPQWVPRAFHRACIAELMNRGKRLWQENYLSAIEAMTDIAAGKGKVGSMATPSERIKAAQFVIERLEGKVPETFIVNTDQRWQLVMDGIVAEVSDEAIARGQRALLSAQELKGELEQEILEAEIIEEEPPSRPSRSRKARR